MIDLTVQRYVMVAAFCFLSGIGVEYRRQLWLRTHSPWELCRLCLAVVAMVAVVVAYPIGGSRLALYPLTVGGLLNLGISMLASRRSDSAEPSPGAPWAREGAPEK